MSAVHRSIKLSTGTAEKGLHLTILLLGRGLPGRRRKQTFLPSTVPDSTLLAHFVRRK